MKLAFEDWMVALSALIFGVGIGWLIWGGRKGAEKRRQPPVETSAESTALVPIETPTSDAADSQEPTALLQGPAQAPSGVADAPVAPRDRQKLEEIERELKDAREFLNEGEEELRLFGEEIAALDGAIKRANGRLRLLIREIRRRALGGASPIESDDDA